jgi:phospholipid/cholesterol/gamma-HCH transport system substrate-binding protein
MDEVGDAAQREDGAPVSRLEKKAVFGIVAVIAFLAVSVVEIGKRNLWFEPKNVYVTLVEDADGLRVGGLVTISGLRVGEVSALDVDPDDRIRVTLKVKQSVAKRLRKDSTVLVSRSFIIGEKRIELTPGSPDSEQLKPGDELPARESTDLSEFLSGKKLAELMSQVEALIAGLNNLVRASDEIWGQYKEGAFAKTFGRIDPLLETAQKLTEDLSVITKEVRKKKAEIPTAIDNGAALLGEMRQDFFVNGLARKTVGNLNTVLEPLATRKQLLEQLLGNLDDLSKELKANPQYAKQVLEAVQELTITLKALQKTWILEGKTEEVKSGK